MLPAFLPPPAGLDTGSHILFHPQQKCQGGGEGIFRQALLEPPAEKQILNVGCGGDLRIRKLFMSLPSRNHAKVTNHNFQTGLLPSHPTHHSNMTPNTIHTEMGIPIITLTCSACGIPAEAGGYVPCGLSVASPGQAVPISSCTPPRPLLAVQMRAARRYTPSRMCEQPNGPGSGNK